MERNQLVSRIRNLQDAAAKTDVLSEQKKGFDQRINELKSENLELKRQRDAVESERNTFEKDIAVYIVENNNLKQQIALINSSQKKRDTAIADNIKEMKKNNDNFNKLKQIEHSALVEKLNEQSKKYESLAKEYERKNTQLEGRCAEFTSSKKDLEAKLERSKSENRTLRSQLQEKENKVTSLESTIATSSSKSKTEQRLLRDKLSSTNKEHEARIAKLEEENSKLQLKIKEEEKRHLAQSCIGRKIKDDVKRKNEVLERDLSEEGKKSKDLQNKLEIAEKKYKSAVEDGRRMQQENSMKIDKYRNKITELERELSENTNTSSNDKEKCEKMEKRVAKLQTELDNAHTVINSKSDFTNKEIKRLKVENNENLQEIQELERERNDLQKSTNEKVVKIQELELKISGLVSKTVMLEGRLKDVTKEWENERNHESSTSKKMQEHLRSRKLSLENQNLQLQTEVDSKDAQIKKLVALSIKHEREASELRNETSLFKQESRANKSKLDEIKRELLQMQQKNDMEVSQLEKTIKELKSELQDRVKQHEETKENEISQLLTENKKNFAEIKKLKRELSESEREIDELMQENKQLQEDKVQHNKQHETMTDLKKNIVIANRTVQQKESDIRTLEDDLKKRNVSLQEVKMEARQYKDELTALQSEIDKSGKMSADAQRDLSFSKKQIEELIENHTKEVCRLKKEIRNLNQEISTFEMTNEEKQRNENSLAKKLSSLERQKNTEIEKLIAELSEVRDERDKLMEEKEAIADRFDQLHESCSVITTIEEQMQMYSERCQLLEQNKAELTRHLELKTKTCNELEKKIADMEENEHENNAKVKNLEKAVSDLKKACFMMEEQVEDLEKFNDKLLAEQKEITTERNAAVKSVRELEKEIAEKNDLIQLMRNQGNEMEMQKTEEMVQLQVAAREEANNVQDLNDELKMMEQKYGNLEVHVNSLQQKINLLKDENSRLYDDIANAQSALSHAEMIRQKCKEGLRTELERAENLDREKTDLQNQLETMQMTKSHENIKLNCTLAQQSKLIDFLQAKVEELEPHDGKKKKKKKNDLYQVPLQYHELQGLLEQEKKNNVELQEKINQFRSDLQSTKAEATRLKHGIGGGSNSHFLSPGSIAAISSIVKSPNVSSKSPTSKSKNRMHHNIPHRLNEHLCTHATKCNVCLDGVRFGRVALYCSECSLACHIKCRPNLTSTCGLPDGLVQHVKAGRKINTASPISCIGSNSNNLKGFLKVLCGQGGWERLWVEFDGDKLTIKDKTRGKSKNNEEIDFRKQNVYAHGTVPSSELNSTARSDLPYVFKLEVGPMTSCWVPRSVYFLAAGYTEKQQWVTAIEQVTMRCKVPLNSKNIGDDHKVLGNEIVSLNVNEKLEMNSSLPLASEYILFGCDEGLFIMTPSTTTIRSRSDLIQISGVKQILQLAVLKSPNLILAVEGKNRRLVTLDVSQIVQKMKSGKGTSFDVSQTVTQVEDVTNCHLFAIGMVEGAIHLCAATPTSVTILRHNDKLGKFFKRKEVATIEPCTCIQFTKCSIIMGTNNFYELELKSYKVDEFINKRNIGIELGNESFPVAIILVSEKNGGQEFLLCYNEFGIFVDGFGKQTRPKTLPWSRLPLSFAFSTPYLIITHFHSVEILKIVANQDHKANFKPPQSYLSLPSPRFLGSAITEGAVYLSSNDGGRITVCCCKGNMADPSYTDVDDTDSFTAPQPKSCLKRRHLTVQSDSSDEAMSVNSSIRRSPSLDSQMTLQSKDFTGSYDSLTSIESRWTVKNKRSRQLPDSSKSHTNNRILRQALYHASCESLDSLDSVLTNEITEDENVSPSKIARSSVNSPKKTPEKPARTRRGRPKLYDIDNFASQV